MQVAEVNAESVEKIDDSTVVATWSKGVPPLNNGPVSLWFEESEGIQVFFADTTLINFDNPLDITSVADVSCSFAGGCTYQVEGVGVATMMAAGKSSLSICDEVCEYIDDESTGELASCKLPPLSTVYSDAAFTIDELKEDLKPRAIFGTLDDNNVPFDDILVVHPVEGPTEDGQCYIGWNYKAEHVGMLKQVKWFMKDVQDKSLYADEVKFQGSNDNSTWTNIFTMGEGIHDGWNYHTYTDPEDYPKYRFYKFTGG